jgi:hypothetical protein
MRSSVNVTVTVHKLSQRRFTADWLASLETDYSRMRSKVSSDWVPSYIKATRPGLEIFKMAGYFPDSPRMHAHIFNVTRQDTQKKTTWLWRTHVETCRSCKMLLINYQNIASVGLL